MVGPFDPILYWSGVALEAHRRDFTYDDAAGRDEAGRGRTSLQPKVDGPTRVSRALAIVHIAMYDALLMADPARFRSAHGEAFGALAAYQEALPPPPAGLSREAAAAGAGAATIRILFDDDFVEDSLTAYRLHLLQLGHGVDAVEKGLAYGATVGRMLADARAEDGSQRPDAAYLPFAVAGCFLADPYGPDLARRPAVGPTWGADVAPFGRYPNGIESVSPSTALGGAPPPEGVPEPLGAFLAAPGWEAELDLVRAKGAVAGTVGLTRTPEETVVGVFWGYDGARGIGVPPRLYNQCLHALAGEHGLGTEAAAVLLAAANLGMADAGIFAWREKYTYHVARPATLLRTAEPGYLPGTVAPPTHPSLTMPPGGAAGPTYEAVARWLAATPTAPTLTESDAGWAPLGAPQTNAVRRGGIGPRSRTPQFPAYPSGHATFGSVCFGLAGEILKALGKDGNAEFELASDEYDGVSVDADGSVRPRHRRRMSLAQAIHENAWSRVHLGVHWPMDAVEGVRLGCCLVEAMRQSPRGPALVLTKQKADA